MNNKPIRISLLLIFYILLCFIYGCAPLAKLTVGRKAITIPQIVADLEPVLKNNKICVSGRIIFQNPTETDIEIAQISLIIKDNTNQIVGKSLLEWQKHNLSSKKELESPVNMEFDLATLNKESISVLLQTSFFYKTLNLRIPLENTIAVLHLGFLKETVTRPLYINIHTKLHSDILGNISIDYVLVITNPAAIDLLLEDATIRIYTKEEGNIAKAALARTLFKAGQENRIKGSINLRNIFDIILRREIIKLPPLRFQLLGKLKVPNTDIYMPFELESVQDVDFSLLPRY